MGIHMQTLFVPYKNAAARAAGLTCLLTTDATEPVLTAFTVTITFSREVTGFTVDDIDVTNAALSDFAGSGAVYTVTVTPDWAGAVTVSVPAGVTAPANLASNTLALEIGEVAFSDDFTAAGPATNGWYSPGAGVIANVAGHLVITPTLGANVVADPTFDTGAPWTFNAGWAYDAVNDEADATATNNSLSQVGALTQHTWYRTELEVKNYAAGSFRPVIGSLYAQTISANGSYIVSLPADGANIGTINATGLTCSIDNWYCYPVDIPGSVALREFDFAYGQFTLNFRRAGGAARGVNIGLILNWEDANNFAVFYTRASGAGNRIHYSTYVAGVQTLIESPSITYADDRNLVVNRHEDGTIDIAYDGANLVLGAPASGLTGKVHGVFATYDVDTWANSFTYTRDF